MNEHLYYIDNSTALDSIRPVSRGQGDKLKTRVKEINLEWVPGQTKVQARFFYLNIKDSNCEQDLFTEFICDQILFFCMKREAIEDFSEKMRTELDLSAIPNFYRRAKDIFVQSRLKNRKNGEVGELVLFSILEHLLDAPRAFCKMRLKSNSNMEVNGSDGIHVRYNKNEDSLYLYWGEAKTYQELSGAIASAADSIQKFRIPNEGGTSIRNFEINLLTDEIDLGHAEANAAVKRYLDPYDDKAKNLKEVHACLAIWDYDAYSVLQTINEEEGEAFFRARYESYILKACRDAESKFIDKGLATIRIQLLLLPVRNVLDLRRSFCQKIGLPFQES